MSSAPMTRVLVHGMFRSGTTLVSRMLGAPRGNLVVADPFVYVFKAYRALLHERFGARSIRPEETTSDWFQDPDHRMHARYLDADLSESVPPAFMERIRRDLIAWKSDQHPRLIERLGELRPGSFAELFGDLLDLCGELYGSGDLSLLGTKLSWCEEFLPAAARALPDLRVLLVTRDVRAIAASQDHQRGPGRGKRPLLFYARHWRKAVGFARHLTLPDSMPTGRIAHLRYEDLVADPEAVLSRACDRLGIPFHPDMVRPECFRDPSESTGWRDNSSFPATGSGIRSESADRWQATLDPSARRTLESLCGPELRWMGYDLSGGSSGSSCAAPERPLQRLIAPGEPLPAELPTWLQDQPAAEHLTNPTERLLEYGYEELRLQAIEGLDLPPALVRQLFPLPNSLARLRGAWRAGRQLNPVRQESIFH